MNILKTLLVAGALSLPVSAVSAATVWNESTNGDLANSVGTSLGALGVGTFDVFGTMANADNDYFSWTLAGSSLTSVSLIKWDSSNPSSTSIVRVSDSVSTTGFSSAFALGNASNLNKDLFALAGVSKSGNGFSSGARTGSGTVDYGFRITTVAAVPVPASISLLLGAIGAMGFAARRRRRKTGSGD